jgi:hypothetical protein
VQADCGETDGNMAEKGSVSLFFAIQGKYATVGVRYRAKAASKVALTTKCCFLADRDEPKGTDGLHND